MSKQTKGYDMANFAHVTPQTLTRAQNVINDQKLRKYSVSAIYKAHNEIFKLREPMQTCDSCLVTRANNVKRWLDWYKASTPAPSLPAPESGTDVTSYALQDGTTILVDGAGVARLAHADRTPVTDADIAAPGDYLLADGQTLTVAEGLATISAEPTPIVKAAGDLLGGVVKNIPQQDAPQQDAPQQDAPQAPEGSIVLQKVDKDTYVADGEAFYAAFTANTDDANKGTVVRVDTGKAVAAGTYATEDTTKVLSVQIGGKATYKSI